MGMRFTAMIFDMPGGNKMYAGMNTKGYDWKKFVLNTFSWLSKIELKHRHLLFI